MNQVRTRQQGNSNRLPNPIANVDTTANSIDFMIEVVQHHGRWLIFLLRRLPRIHHQPIRGLIAGELAHGDTVVADPISGCLGVSGDGHLITGGPHWPDRPSGKHRIQGKGNRR